jgi:hypothetical protein
MKKQVRALHMAVDYKPPCNSQTALADL